LRMMLMNYFIRCSSGNDAATGRILGSGAANVG
jgi:hypothetical protein